MTLSSPGSATTPPHAPEHRIFSFAPTPYVRYIVFDVTRRQPLRRAPRHARPTGGQPRLAVRPCPRRPARTAPSVSRPHLRQPRPHLRRLAGRHPRHSPAAPTRPTSPHPGTPRPAAAPHPSSMGPHPVPPRPGGARPHPRASCRRERTSRPHIRAPRVAPACARAFILQAGSARPRNPHRTPSAIGSAPRPPTTQIRLRPACHRANS